MKTLSNLKAERLLWWAQQHRNHLIDCAKDLNAHPDAQRQLEAITKHIADAEGELGHNDVAEPTGLRNKLGNVD